MCVVNCKLIMNIDYSQKLISIITFISLSAHPYLLISLITKFCGLIFIYNLKLCLIDDDLNNYYLLFCILYKYLDIYN